MKDKMVDNKWRTRTVCVSGAELLQRLNVINIVYEKVCVCVCVCGKDKGLSTALNISRKLQSPEGEQHRWKK